MTTTTENINLFIDHLFRHESGKMVSVLTKILGPANIDLAEDVVQDAMVEAINQWTYKGVPDNPTGWLYNVAKYKAINFINRDKLKHKYSSEAIYFLQSEWTAEPAINHFFSEQEIEDDQLRMMFICCHPSISPDSQIALTLKTLCGFSIPEIAKAFLTNEENVNKRLVRARQTIRDNKLSFEVPSGNEFESRLNSVLESIYLLFNEGYNASEGTEIIRFELCDEAIRLAQMIAHYPKIQQKKQALALLSLMLLNSSRFNARRNSKGEIVELAKQERTLWSRDLINKGITYLDESVSDNGVSKYHILAAISAHHCTAADDETTDWENILSLYNNLLQIDDSPLVLLNRAVAIAKVYGVEKAIDEMKLLSGNNLLQNYPYYHSALAEFYLKNKSTLLARQHFEKAKSFTLNEQEKAHLDRKIASCN